MAERKLQEASGYPEGGRGGPVAPTATGLRRRGGSSDCLLLIAGFRRQAGGKEEGRREVQGQGWRRGYAGPLEGLAASEGRPPCVPVAARGLFSCPGDSPGVHACTRKLCCYQLGPGCMEAAIVGGPCALSPGPSPGENEGSYTEPRGCGFVPL
ncbi:hypothetical protein NDU88_000844 [Pleurodeles waltl]|uniref:Uncharacterized protein n=1 Tax=Pleurodeles waltl TaxID=8319 RepID=A0AAV7LE74_PLEWA|nr:hypothetical protein NDU88_000844 [Pleurodeles waltl]